MCIGWERSKGLQAEDCLTQVPARAGQRPRRSNGCTLTCACMAKNCSQPCCHQRCCRRCGRARKAPLKRPRKQWGAVPWPAQVATRRAAPPAAAPARCHAALSGTALSTCRPDPAATCAAAPAAVPSGACEDCLALCIAMPRSRCSCTAQHTQERRCAGATPGSPAQRRPAIVGLCHKTNDQAPPHVPGPAARRAGPTGPPTATSGAAPAQAGA